MSEKENEEVTGQEQETNDTANSTSENGETQEEENVIEEQVAESVKEPTLEEKYAELNNKYVRLYSDFDNFRKRTIKEKADIISTANGSLMADLLGTLDDFERAIANNEKVEDVESLREGFKLIYNKYFKTHMGDKEQIFISRLFSLIIVLIALIIISFCEDYLILLGGVAIPLGFQMGTHMKEAVNINLGLLALKKCISALNENGMCSSILLFF
jgi:hypothetical protein